MKTFLSALKSIEKSRISCCFYKKLKHFVKTFSQKLQNKCKKYDLNTILPGSCGAAAAPGIYGAGVTGSLLSLALSRICLPPAGAFGADVTGGLLSLALSRIRLPPTGASDAGVTGSLLSLVLSRIHLLPAGAHGADVTGSLLSLVL